MNQTQNVGQDNASETQIPAASAKRKSKPFRKLNLFLRRIHLYLGLFLLPWVLLYGVTAALFNHHSWMPDGEHVRLNQQTPNQLDEAFPAPTELAQQVIESLKEQKPDASITLHPDFDPQFTGPIAFETWIEGQKLSIEIDPMSFESQGLLHHDQDNSPPRIWNDIHNLKLEPNPRSLAHDYATETVEATYTDAKPELRDLGWCKLNFIALVDQTPVRVTYVLRDGHVDAFQFTGENGMSLRRFLLRLHTSHGYPPHWNYRFLWSVIVDIMALAMLSWALTGLTMWWQLKRTRRIGGFVLIASVAAAVLMFLGMSQFYAQTLL